MRAQWKRLLPTTILCALVVVLLISMLVWSNNRINDRTKIPSQNQNMPEDQLTYPSPNMETENVGESVRYILQPQYPMNQALQIGLPQQAIQHRVATVYGASDIRVLIKSNDYQSNLHANVMVYSKAGLRVIYPDCVEEFRGEKTLGPDYFEEMDIGESVVVEPVEDIDSGTYGITLQSVKRQQGNPTYAGTLYITRSAVGYYIVNHVPLETYLYSVVPSEMPAYYSDQALCAQAVCARTYALRYMLHPGLNAYGADVDDSTGYQVYNNIARCEKTDLAVDMTAGRVLLYGDAPAETFFYSTSCGISADETVWNMDECSRYEYLGVRRIRAGNAEDKAWETEDKTDNPDNTNGMWDYSDEDRFAAFIRNTESCDNDDYEKDFPYYRWTFTVPQIDSEELLARLKNRYSEAPSTIQRISVWDGVEHYDSILPEHLGKIYAIQVCDRAQSGAVRSLRIIGSEAGYMVYTCNSVRAVLALSDGTLQKQDGAVERITKLLPSAFFTIEEADGAIVLYGGGLGHGVGMSQNGAEAMANAGMNYIDILTFFYQGTRIGVLQYEKTSNDTSIFTGIEKG